MDVIGFELDLIVLQRFEFVAYYIYDHIQRWGYRF